MIVNRISLGCWLNKTFFGRHRGLWETLTFCRPNKQSINLEDNPQTGGVGAFPRSRRTDGSLWYYCWRCCCCVTSLATWRLLAAWLLPKARINTSRIPICPRKPEQVGRFSRSEWKTNTCQWGNRLWHNISIQRLSCWFTLVLSLFLSLSLFGFYTSSISRFRFLCQCRFSTFIPVVPPLRKAYFMLSSVEGLCSHGTVQLVFIQAERLPV